MNSTAVYLMSKEDKVEESIRRSLPLLPTNVRHEVEAMLTKEALAIMVSIITLWAISHFFGVGEIADIILLIVGVTALGGVAVQVAQELYSFGTSAINARSETELDKAAGHFAKAVALGGVTAVMAFLLRQSPKKKVFKEHFLDVESIHTATAPSTSGKLFYKPTITKDPTMPRGEGATTKYGDIFISSKGTATDQQMALLHEKVHSFLTPKLQILREMRASLRINSYSQSYLLRYLEEALAETVAHVGVKGFSNIFEAITFPLRYDYVTITAMKAEVAGIFVGPITVSGITYKVYIISTTE